ncbi:MAG: hypothetical protein Harvfovirus78_6 [Harvfovirus sp.]|uniref:Uncharacterized protein n=1 Tax=Harvfovirus sp. TaxID=2487768 RepID=A0A3G5A3Y5_9VIRU|nr:MAG: hypothetical protein Harvfovirus78_6 [Harvfovirus sp.]
MNNYKFGIGKSLIKVASFDDFHLLISCWD